MAIGDPSEPGTLVIDTHVGLVTFTAIELAGLLALVVDRASQARIDAYVDAILDGADQPTVLDRVFAVD